LGHIPLLWQRGHLRELLYWADESLTKMAALPKKGDVPQPDPMLAVSRNLTGPSRARLRDEGTFMLVAAFDHPRVRGTVREDGFAITFSTRKLTIDDGGDAMTAPRDWSAFVSSVYSRCECGEARSVFVPRVTKCSVDWVGS